MSAAIASIQQQAYDKDASLTEVVSRAVSLSSMLRLRQVTLWLRHELSGYPEDEAVPVYRQGEDGRLTAWMSGRGWVPARLPSSVGSPMRSFEQRASVGEIELNCLPSRRQRPEYIDVSMAEQAELRTLTGMDANFYLAIPHLANQRVLRAVRVAIGYFTEDLLALGLDHEVMRFTDEERLRALALNDRLEDYFQRAHAQAAQLQPGAPPRILGRIFGRR